MLGNRPMLTARSVRVPFGLTQALDARGQTLVGIEPIPGPVTRFRAIASGPRGARSEALGASVADALGKLERVLVAP